MTVVGGGWGGGVIIQWEGIVTQSSTLWRLRTFSAQSYARLVSTLCAFHEEPASKTVKIETYQSQLADYGSASEAKESEALLPGHLLA